MPLAGPPQYDPGRASHASCQLSTSNASWPEIERRLLEEDPGSCPSEWAPLVPWPTWAAGSSWPWPAFVLGLDRSISASTFLENAASALSQLLSSRYGLRWFLLRPDHAPASDGGATGPGPPPGRGLPLARHLQRRRGGWPRSVASRRLVGGR